MEDLLNNSLDETVLHAHLPMLVTLLEWISAGIDLCAVGILILGAVRFLARVVPAEILRQGAERQRATNTARYELGGYILAGLELFIVSDVIHTALSLAIADLFFLLMLVVIRAIISFFLDRELDQLRRDLGE